MDEDNNNNNNLKKLFPQEKKESSIEVLKGNGGCYFKQRHILAVVGFLGLCNATFIRNNVGIAVLSMINATHPNNTHTGGTLNWTTTEEGMFLGSYFYGYAFGNFLGALVVSRLGFRNPFGISMIVCAVISLLTPAAAYVNFYLVVACRAVTGLLQAVCVPALTSMWSRWAPPFERSILVSISFAGYLGGYIILFPAASAIMEWLSWEAIFYFTGGSSLIWAICFFLVVSETPQKSKRISSEERDYIIQSVGIHKVNNLKTPWKSIFTSSCVWGLFCGHFADAWFQYCLPLLLPTFLVDVFHLNIMESGLILTLPFLLQWIVALVAARVTDKLREKGRVSTTLARKFNTSTPLVVAGVLTAACGYVTNEPQVVVLFTLALTISGLTYAGYMPNCLDIAPQHASMVMGISNSIATSAGFFGPFTAALIIPDKTDRLQWQVFFWITCCVCLFGSIMYGLLASGVEQPWGKVAVSDCEEGENENCPFTEKPSTGI